MNAFFFANYVEFPTSEPRCPSACTASAATTAPATTAATTATATPTAMASPTVLTFDAEGRAVDFDVWVNDLQLFLQCDSRDGVSLFDHTSGVSTAPTATDDSTVRSKWTPCDAFACLAVRSHLPPAERAHFGQYKTVVARYSSPGTAALSRLMLPYHPTMRRVLSSQDVTFDESVSYYRLFPYRAASPPPPPPLFLAPGTPPLLSPPPVQSQSQFQPTSPQPSPSSYSGPTRGLTERREPESRPVSPESHSALPVRTACAGHRVSRPRPPPVPGTHSMTLRPSTPPQRVPLLSPPASSLPDGPDPESDSLRAASPTVSRFLATAVTDHLFESTAASALVAELVDFAAACRLNFATSLVAESASVSVCPPSVTGECALGTDVLEDRQEEFECFAAAVPHLAAMDTEMASWKSTGTYVDEVPPPGANIISGMWIFRVKRPPGSPPVFKAR
ncbi:unnamed protein product [Closterium sp. NIES-54]